MFAELPTETIQDIFGWIHPGKVHTFRALSRRIDQCLSHRDFALINLNRWPNKPDRKNSEASVNRNEYDRLWFFWPANYQQVYAERYLIEITSFFAKYDCGRQLIAFPSSISVMTRLKDMFFENVGICGPLPKELGALTSLVRLGLTSMEVTSICPELYTLENLKFLCLSDNKIEGTLDPRICKMIKLSTLSLSRNKLTGTIPDTIGKLKRLNCLDLSCNLFSGAIPPTIGSLRRLTTLHLSGNQLSGSIPLTFETCSSLRFLNLSSNHLDGEIPVTIWKGLTQLETLDLSSNNFCGEIPKELAAFCEKLTTIRLAHNNLVGEIPAKLGKRVGNDDESRHIENIDLSYNRLVGQLPDSIRWGHVKVCNLSNNRLTGTLPDTYYSHRIQRFNVENNEFSGTIPSLLLCVESLCELKLGGNKFDQIGCVRFYPKISRQMKGWRI